MSRREYIIRGFSPGLMDEPDPRDIPKGAATFNLNNDPNSYGILRGIAAAGSTFHATPTVKMSNWITRDDGTRDLVYTDGSNVKSLLDFYGTPSAGNTASGEGYSFVRHPKGVYIGMGTSADPQLATRIPAAKFNGLIAHSAGAGTDDFVIDASEYDGTATTYYAKITNTAGASGTFTSVLTYQGDKIDQLARFQDSAHGLTQDNIGDEITLTTGGGSGTYNGTYNLYSVPTADEFILADQDTGDPILYDSNDSGTWTLTNAAGSTQWKWSTDDITYYPTATGLSTKEFAKVGSNGLKARFLNETGKTTSDKWTITFSSANAETLYIEDAECYSYETNDSTDTFFIQIEASAGNKKDEGLFVENKKYFYAYSIIYDGYQESPLVYRAKGNDPTSFTTDVALSDVLVDFKVTTTALPKRITGFNLWGAESDDSQAEKPDNEFQYITSLTMDGSRQSSNTYTFKLKDVYVRKNTYENETNLSEVIRDSSVKYTLSAAVGERLFVGNCERPEYDGGSHLLFRSQPKRYSIFDWVNEVLPLPTKPTAMISFLRRLIVFDESTMYIIDPESFSIEQTIPVGCPYGDGFTIAENALYWADTQAAYKYDGTTLTDISTSSIRSTYQAVFDAVNFNGLKLIYDSEIKTVLFCYRSTTFLLARSYHILNNRWDNFTIGESVSTTNWGVFVGKSGESYYSDQTNIYRIFTTSRRTWQFTSGRIDFGTPGLQKKIYYIRLNSNTDPTLTFRIDGGSSTAITNTDEVIFGGDWGKGTDIQIALTDSVGTKEVYSITIIYRELGAR